ncbi:aspartyl protease family protein [Pseudoalteromonas luteoviolacea]|uniref:pepsin/retropepsin-like aspartic protease family protein n=1 Tax=Pseudoalteromonas luteoviolacea TaxID=43657 RepID=UPI001F40F55D|nr:pepsin/retropepsin-like aspartic protease family protein [Pseudoalteromonas luteoviolacea]MCF6440894.1 aspartyl protease family protein [Pseudoalteromonas luteoviolacea]
MTQLQIDYNKVWHQALIMFKVAFQEIHTLKIKANLMKYTLLLVGLLFNAFTHAAVTPWQDFTYQNGLITIPVKVSDINSYAVLDTGANMNAINENFVTKHKLSYTHSGNIDVEGAFDVKRNKIYQKVPVSFFGIDTHLERLPALNLSMPDNAVLFGQGFFKLFNTQIDYPNKRIRLLTHDHLNIKEFENIEFKLQKGFEQPIVKIILEGEPVWMLLDTGFTGGVLIERRFAKKFGWLGTQNPMAYFTGANTQEKMENVLAKEVQFGPFTLSNVKIAFPAEGSKVNVTSQYSHSSSHVKGVKVRGIVGYDVFKHFVMTMDLKNGNLHVGVPKEQL